MSGTYKAIEVSKTGQFSEVSKPLLDPGPGHARIRVEACGVCHSDSATVEGLFPIDFPRVPGHEVVGRIDALVPVSRAGRSVSGLESGSSLAFADAVRGRISSIPKA
jgi:D-arabinose 1-dehydrogenase-like Zn-dependent alcohol dehydrogenase